MTVLGESVAYRIEIAGMGIEAVSDPAMEQTLADGRVRVRGLLLDGLTIEEEAQPETAELETSPMTISIVDRQYDSVWTQWFATRGDKTWLTADLEAAGTTVTCEDTGVFSAGDTIHINTEAMEVSSVDSSTQLTVTNRARWGTIAQKHWTEDGANARNPIITKTYPLLLEGRRVYLYRYTTSDDLQGDGTQVWVGVLTSDARLDSDGCTWSLRAESVITLWDQDIGADLDQVSTIRGIYYPSTTPFKLMIIDDESPAAWRPSAVDYNPGSGSRLEISVAGFWETQAEFCAAVQAEIDSSYSGNYSIQILPNNEDQRWMIIARSPPTGTPGWVYFQNERRRTEGLLEPDFTGDMTTDFQVTWTIDASEEGQGRVPRGVFGDRNLSRAADGASSAFPGNVLYLDGRLEPSTDLALSVSFSDDDAFESRITVGDPLTVSDNAVRLRRGISDRRWMYPGNLPEISVVRSRGAGTSVDTFQSSLTTQAVTLANKGATPFITTADLGDWSSAIGDATDGDRSALVNRTYVSVQSAELREYFTHEFRLLGVYPGLDASGKIRLNNLVLPTPTQVVDWEADSSSILADDGPITWERNAFGTLDSIELHTGYNPYEDNHEGPTYIVRDVLSAGAVKKTRRLEIKPLSLDTSDVTPEDATIIGTKVLGIFGRPYYMVTFQLPQSYLTTALVGSVGAITTHRIPSSTGVRGITRAIGVVISRQWELSQPRGTISMLVTEQAIAGYTPTIYVDSNAVVSGNQYDVVVSFEDPLLLTSMAPSGAVLSDFYEVGDRVELHAWNTILVSATALEGTVNAVTDGTSTLRVTFDSAPTFSGDQVIRFAQASEATDAQQLFCYMADSSARIDFATSTSAREFAG